MTFQSTIVIEHETSWPAIDALVAGTIAGLQSAAASEAERVRFVRVRSHRSPVDRPGGNEHVAAYGALVANGFLWPEREMGTPLDANSDEVLETGRPIVGGEVISFNPALFPAGERETARAAVRRRTGGGLWISVRESGDRLALVMEDADGDCQSLGIWVRDRYGRLPRGKAPEPLRSLLADRCGVIPAPMPEDQCKGASGGSPRISVVGEREHVQYVYPAVLAALGDAADRLGVLSTIDVVSPRQLTRDGWVEALRDSDGIVLPGGSDMTQTAGQVTAAGVALERSVPTLGFCLGMQTMVTAFARLRAGLPGAGLEEVEPGADPLTIVRLVLPEGTPVHRLGAESIHLTLKTRLRALYGRAQAIERLNHRYHLNQEILPILARAGLAVSAWSQDHAVVEGIEAPSHPFFVGLQGHPEVSSRLRSPHPAFRGFLAAAVESATRRTAAGSDGIGAGATNPSRGKGITRA